MPSRKKNELKVSAPPAKVGILLAFVNLEVGHVPLPEISEMFSRADAEYGEHYVYTSTKPRELSRNEAIENWKNKLASVGLQPETVIAPLHQLGHTDLHEDCGYFLRNNAEAELLAAANFVEIYKDLLIKIIGLGEHLEKSSGRSVIISKRLAKAPVFVYVRSTNKLIGFKILPGLRALEGCRLDRIRICPVCSRFYWVVREPGKACDKKCVDKLRKGQAAQSAIETKIRRERVVLSNLKKNLSASNKLISERKRAIAKLEKKLETHKTKFGNSDRKPLV